MVQAWSSTAGLRAARTSADRVGLDIVMPGREPVEVSEVWTMDGWAIRFVRLAPGASIQSPLDEGTVHAKVVVGALTDPALEPFGAPRTVRPTVIDAAELTAGPEGALLAIIVATPEVPDNVESVSQLAIEGPLADGLVWETFSDRFGGVDVFRDVDAHIVPGFHLLDGDETEIAYLHFWAMGPEVDSSTHNHGGRPSALAPAFVEIHWVFNNGTRLGGMYECDEPGAPRTRLLVQRGEEHGPYWDVTSSGAPMRRANGAVSYPWHGWRAGAASDGASGYDVVAAFEINPDSAALVRPS